MKRLLSIAVGLMLSGSSTFAETCESLAHRIGASKGLPDGVLAAIARKESGYSPRGDIAQAWPWTINEAGRSSYFESRPEAEAYLERALARGDTNIDIGCMQINYRWHGEAFASPSQMFEPSANITYAADFLTALYARLGSWEQAIAHYHSSSPDLGPQYAASVQSLVADMGGEAQGVDQFASLDASAEQMRGFLMRRTVAPLVIKENVERALLSNVRRPRGRPVIFDSMESVSRPQTVSFSFNSEWKEAEIQKFRQFFDSHR